MDRRAVDTVNQLPTRDSIGSKGYFRLLENAMDKQSIQVETTLLTGAPLPLPPIYQVLSPLWGAGRKPAQYMSATHRKFPDY